MTGGRKMIEKKIEKEMAGPDVKRYDQAPCLPKQLRVGMHISGHSKLKVTAISD